ncbi:uncharacterized protein LOC116005810 [Ipomoea triloba]|uniref:uncharacterized protein LOC116005810 n=1 Tax=Ipomoea triloba TaxID=35885 RepID=UPI00125DE747|nr:uncharacterized protein LOC116005810 [Ipomoea triloba]
MSGDQVVALICCLPNNDSNANVDFSIAPQNALFLSREISFEELSNEIKICLNVSHDEDIMLWGKYHQNPSQQVRGPSTRRTRVDRRPTVEQVDAPELDIGDYDSDGSSDTSGIGDGVDYWDTPDDSAEYVPPSDRQSSSMPPQWQSYVQRSDDATWYDDVPQPSQYYQSPSSALQIGMMFGSYKDLHNLVTNHNLAQHQHFKTSFKKGHCWKATCLYPVQCSWTINAGKISNMDQWIIKKLNDNHTCRVDYTEGGEDYILTSRVIGDLILPKIEEDPTYKIKYIQQDVKTKWGVDVGYKKAWYGRVRTLETLYGKWDESYNELPQLLMALQQTNPGSVIEFVTNPTSDSNAFRFKYAFRAFKAAIDGFKYCLPVITIDGTHLYGKYGGHLLLAVSMNGNKEIFPIVYSIVDGETEDSWTWFMKLLAQHVFGNVEHICIISDRHGGIDVAFRDFPELRCAMDTRAFDATMKKIRVIDDGAYNYLMAIPERFWALSHDGGFRHGLMTTNSSESFNNNLKGCRVLPVAALVKKTYEKLSLMFAHRRTQGLIMQQAGLPWPRTIFDEMLNREKHKYQARFRRHDDVQGLYSVAIERSVNASGRPNYVGVNINECVCNCGQWSVDGLPCVHAHVACHYVSQVADGFVPEKFAISKYILCYEGIIMPLLEEEYWPSTTFHCLPPDVSVAVNRQGDAK